MTQKKKRILSFLMAAAVFLTGSGIPTNSASSAPQEDSNDSIYHVTLPHYEECRYEYDKTKCTADSKESEKIKLQYKAGEQVSFTLLPESQWEISSYHLKTDSGNEILLPSDQKTEIHFTMPEDHVKLLLKFQKKEESLPKESDCTDILDISGTEPADESDKKIENLPGDFEYADIIEAETDDLSQEMEDLWSEETDDFWDDTESEPAKSDHLEETQQEEVKTENETGEESENFIDGFPSDKQDELFTETDIDLIQTELPEIDIEADSEPEEESDSEAATEFMTEEVFEEESSTEDSSDSETEFTTEAASETESNTEDNSDFETEFLTEAVSEEEFELESESFLSLRPDGTYRVFIPESSEYEISLQNEKDYYLPGEEVIFTVSQTSELSLMELCTYCISGEADFDSVPDQLPEEETDLNLTFYEEDSTFHFKMPESDVLLCLTAESDQITLAAETSEDDPVPNQFKLVVKGIYFAPSALHNGNAASTHKTVVFYESDGSTVVREAYCIQPRYNSPGSGTLYDKNDIEYLDGNSGTTAERKMSKGMFYLFGGPAWGKTIELSDGTSVNLKTIMNNAGCSSDSHYYTITHYVLSYFYLNGSNWNYNSEHENVLNSSGINLVKTLASTISRMPNPNTSLTVSELTATYRKSSDTCVTQLTIYKSFDENTAVVTLPKGIRLINETTGKTSTGTVTLNSGDHFRLETDSSVAAGLKELTLTCKYPVDYQALKLGLAGYQDIGFSYYSGEKQLRLTVTVPEIPKSGNAFVQKLNAESKNAKSPNTTAYSLAGAVYTIYKDKACTSQVAVLTTKADGSSNPAELEAGTYYAKETTASKGYLLDEKIYTLKVTAGETVSFTSYEEPIQKNIEIQKYDSVTGKNQPYNGKVSFADAEYTIYKNASCSEKVETIKTDDSGYAKSSALYLADYYVKETKAPKGYQLDPTVHKVEMDDSTVKVYKIKSEESVKTAKIQVQKYDSRTGKAEPYDSDASFSGAEYTIYTDAACTKVKEVLVTNAAGNAVSKELPIAVYYIKETLAPKGYALDTKVHKINMNADDLSEIYIVKSEEPVIRKAIELQKYDLETGKPQPNHTAVYFENAEYTIYKDSSCKKAQEILVLNANGYAKSSELLPGTYYIKETKAPVGYEKDSVVHKVTIADDDISTYQIKSYDPMIRGSILLMKFLDDSYSSSILQEWIDRGELAGIRFVLTHEDPSVAPIELITDQYGCAASENQALAYGTWTIQEDPSTTPDGYSGLKEAKIQITQNGVQVKYVVTNALESAMMKIVKKDSQTGENIPKSGVQFQILDDKNQPLTMQDPTNYGTLTDTFTTNDDGEIYLTQPLRKGTYLLKEITAPEGYLLADPIPFEITEHHTAEEPFAVECFDKKQTGIIRITKKDAASGETLGTGFSFEIRTAEDITDASDQLIKMEIDGVWSELKKGTVVAVVSTDENGIAVSPELYLGKYEIQERTAGEYYSVSDQIYTAELTYDSSLVSVLTDIVAENQKTQLLLQKEDSNADLETPKPLSDVCFRIFTESEREETGYSAEEIAENMLEVGVEYRTDENGQILFTDLRHETTYYIYESKALPGYHLSHEVYRIYVDKDGRIDHETQYLLKINNQPNEVEIIKWDIAGGKELPGAALTLRDEAGTVIEHWISEKEPHRIKGLSAGIYTLTEEQAPEGYALAETITFELTDSLEVQRVVMKDEPIKVLISKKEITSMEELPGAFLEIRTAEGELVESWISDYKPHYLNLPAGTYTLTEVAAPAKYAKAETITFEVTDTLEVQTVEMVDAPIRVLISKQDITTQKELPGAQLIVTDASGNIIESWISSNEPHLMNLAVGIYTLTEVTAPNGYEKAETITFEVTDTAELQKVTMYDKPEEPETETETESESETESETEVETETNTEVETETEAETEPSSESKTPEETETEKNKENPPTIVQTGDFNRILPSVLLIAAGLLLLLSTVYSKKKQHDSLKK